MEVKMYRKKYEVRVENEEGDLSRAVARAFCVLQRQKAEHISVFYISTEEADVDFTCGNDGFEVGELTENGILIAYSCYAKDYIREYKRIRMFGNVHADGTVFDVYHKQIGEVREVQA